MWNWDPLIIVPVLTGVIVYLFWVRFKWNRPTLLFLLGNLTLLIALVSPIATIGETGLFSVHMLQHMMLTLIAAPLLILGMPQSLAQFLLRPVLLRRILHRCADPRLAWCIGVGTLWVWHLPVLYEAALQQEWIHIVQHLCFVAAAAIFWNAVLNPIDAFRLKTAQAILYVVSAGFVNSLLAIMITFAPRHLYPYYSNPVGASPQTEQFIDGWGLGALLDQQLGGALMWVMGAVISGLVVMALLATWFQKPERDVWVQERQV